MKRKIYYNVDPTPSPECPKLIDSYNETCKEHNDYVELVKKRVKKDEDECKENIKKWKEERKELEDKNANALKKFNDKLSEFAKDIPKLDIYKESTVRLHQKFYAGYTPDKDKNNNNKDFQSRTALWQDPVTRKVWNRTYITTTAVDKSVEPNANCYMIYSYVYTDNKYILPRLEVPPSVTEFNSKKAGEAIKKIIDIEDKIKDVWTDPTRAKELFFHQQDLHQLGFVNDVVEDVLRDNNKNIIIDKFTGKPTPTKRWHNGDYILIPGTTPPYKPVKVYAGGFKIIRDCKSLFVTNNPAIVKNYLNIDDNKEAIKKLREKIEECQSYVDNIKDKKGNPLNERRLKDKNNLDDRFKEKEKLLKDKMKEIKDKNCTAPTKCVQTIYNP